MEVIERITIGEIYLARPSKIFYGANTCWWTHDASHLSLTPPATGDDVRRLAERLRLNSSTPDAPIDPFMERARQALAGPSLPCDPRGGVLFETDNWEGFLRNAEENAAHYGKHGLRAFMAAHHLNSFVSLRDPHPWCDPNWQAYNDALDRLDERKRARQ